MQHPIQTSADSAPSDIDPVAIGQRIRRVMADAKLDGVTFAARVGVPYTTMRAYLSSSPRPPSAEFLVGVYRVFGVMPSWLLSGDGPSTREGVANVSGPDDGQVLIPRYAARASAGPGVLAEASAEYHIGTISVPRSWLRARGLHAEHLRALLVRGTSMQPVLNDGDLAVMNTADTKPRSGYLYVMRHDDELLVKYCELLPTGALRVSSANPAFSPYDIDLAKASDFAVLGRVVTSVHDW